MTDNKEEVSFEEKDNSENDKKNGTKNGAMKKPQKTLFDF
jgi:hypothetical protein